MGRGLLLALAGLLASCGQNVPEPEPPLAPTRTAVETASPSAPQPVRDRAAPPIAEPRLTPNGYGPLLIGMTPDEAARALGSPLESLGGEAGKPELCWHGRNARLPGVAVMVEEGRVARIDLLRDSPVRTDKGLGLGATREDVRAAYGPALEEGPHKYLDAPAAYLEAWSPDRSRGIRYEVDEKGVVTAVYAGGQAVGYVEGCA